MPCRCSWLFCPKAQLFLVFHTHTTAEKGNKALLKTRMKELREKIGITQEALAEKVDVTRQTILFLEKGKYNPSLRLAYKISRHLNARIEDVFSFDDEL